MPSGSTPGGSSSNEKIGPISPFQRIVSIHFGGKTGPKPHQYVGSWIYFPWQKIQTYFLTIGGTWSPLGSPSFPIQRFPAVPGLALACGPGFNGLIYSSQNTTVDNAIAAGTAAGPFSAANAARALGIIVGQLSTINGNHGAIGTMPAFALPASGQAVNPITIKTIPTPSTTIWSDIILPVVDTASSFTPPYDGP